MVPILLLEKSNLNHPRFSCAQGSISPRLIVLQYKLEQGSVQVRRVETVVNWSYRQVQQEKRDGLQEASSGALLSNA